MTPQDVGHKAMWDAITALKNEIDVNGYGRILRSLAQREENKRIFWAALKKPLSIVSKLAWIVAGALIWGVANHVFKFWPVGTP